MKQAVFDQLEGYMLQCMQDSAHDKEHVYRVLYLALNIAEHEPQADSDVLIAACLLHDIGRQAQYDDPTVCHAVHGAEMAESYLMEHGFEPIFVRRVCDCIRCHRFRKNTPPESLEARILFDADKLDATGAMGIARTLLYNGKMDEPLYSLTKNGALSDGRDDQTSSFFQEYHYKLTKLYDRFYTQRGRELAMQRRRHAEAYFADLFRETAASYDTKPLLQQKYLEIF